MEPFYQGEPILAVAAVDELTAVEAIERITVDYEALPFVVDPVESLRPNGSNARLQGNVWYPPPLPQGTPPQGPPAAPADSNAEMERRNLCRGTRRPAADGRGARGVVVRRSRGRLPRCGDGRRRDLRGAVDQPSDDGEPQRDELLAERQAVSLRLDAERDPHRGECRPVGRDRAIASRPDLGVLRRGLRQQRHGRSLHGHSGVAFEEGRCAGHDAHQPRGRTVHRPRAHRDGGARQGGLPQGRPHHGDRPVHRAGQRRVRAHG